MKKSGSASAAAAIAMHGFRSEALASASCAKEKFVNYSGVFKSYTKAIIDSYVHPNPNSGGEISGRYITSITGGGVDGPTDAVATPTISEGQCTWSFASWTNDQENTPTGVLENPCSSPPGGWIRTRIGDAICATNPCSSQSEQKVNIAVVRWQRQARYE